MSRKTTIRDVANGAGVGLGTVSRVLNNNPNVSEATRKKVLQVAEELNYVPNGAARMLVRRSRSVATVALLLPVVENQFFFEVIKSIYTRLKQDKYNIMIFNTDHGQDSVVHHIVEQQLGAVLSLGDPPLNDVEKRVLNSHHIPFLYVDYHDEDANYIIYDNELGGRMAADYFISKGCKKVIMVGLIDRSQQQRDRFEGFKTKMEEQGRAEVSEIFLTDEEEALAISRTLLQDSSIDGLFYFSDTMAYGGIQAKMELSSQIPIMGYDDIFPSRFMKLSTIRQSSKILGTTSAEQIIRLVESTDKKHVGPMVQMVVPPELIDRES